MLIRCADFILSATKPGHYPPEGPPEIAFAGRSNVGKSSLINTLVNRKKLVKTSQTPGRTQALNFFSVNNAFVFVDLPGYGYAKVSKKMRKQWGPMVETYLKKRSSLAGVILICDIRREPGHEEKDFMAWMQMEGIPHLLAATKADKISRNKQASRKKALAAGLCVDPDSIVLFSAKTRLGREVLWEAIGDIAGQGREDQDDGKSITE